MNEKLVCINCISDFYLEKEIKNLKQIEKCDYCRQTDYCITLNEIAEYVDGVFQLYYREGDYFPGMDQMGDPLLHILQEDFGISEFRVAEDLDSLLTTDFNPSDPKDAMIDSVYMDDVEYERRELFPGFAFGLWDTYCKTVKHDSRFFSDIAKTLLDELFTDLKLYHTWERENAVKTITPGNGTKLYRGRLALTSAERIQIVTNPYTELGNPPSSYAGAGRLNPAGISYFYGALNPDTCIAELRPIVGGSVIIGEFEISKPVKVLDLTIFRDLNKELSLFDPNYEDELSQVLFFNGFNNEVSKPVLPSDEALEYIPTQVLAEYLKQEFQPELHGIMYGSSQHGADEKNIMLFRDLPEIGNLPCATYNDSITEMLPDKGYDPSLHTLRFSSEEDKNLFDNLYDTAITSPPDVCLMLKPGSLKVYMIEATNFNVSENNIQAYYFPDTDPSDYLFSDYNPEVEI